MYFLYNLSLLFVTPFLLIFHTYRSISRGRPPALWQRFTGGRNGSLWYYDQLANAFLRLIPGPAADRLVLVVKEMHLAA